MTICARQGCNKNATHVPKLCVPATGQPIDTHQPLAMMLGLECCEEHIATMKPADFFEFPEYKKFFEVASESSCKRQGIAYIAPDFDRAFITKVRMDHSDYLHMVKMRGEHHAAKAKPK